MKLNKKVLVYVFVLGIMTSCSKNEELVMTNEANTLSITSSIQSSTEPNNKVYIFIEPCSKVNLVGKYLKDSVASTPSRPFIGFAAGFAITNTNKNDVLNYMDLKYFYNGQLPAVITSDIPQTSGGVDSYGNPIKAYNFKTIKINKSQINDMAWVTVFIPVEAMKSDTYKQTKILSYGSGLKTTVINTQSTLYNYIFDYKGGKIPNGKYRMYTTFVGTSMRYSLTGSGDVYIKGND